MQTFLGRDLFDFFPNFDSIEHGQMDDTTIDPVGIGSGTPWKPTTTLKRTLKVPFQFKDRLEWRNFRDAIASHGGRLNGFWLPIWLTDYPSTMQDAGQNLILMDNVGLQGVFNPDGQFAFIALIKPTGPDVGGVIEPHQVTDVDPSGDQEQLTLDGNIVDDFGTTPGSAVLCGLMFARVDDAEIKYNFVTDGFITCEVTFTELPKEYTGDEAITRPIYLIEAQRGGSTWRTTNFGQSVERDGELYAADNIDIGVIRAALDFLSEGLDITVASDRTDHPLAYYVSNRNALEITNFIIFKVDATPAELDRDNIFYSGITGASRRTKEGQIEFQCSSIFRLGETLVPKPQIQRLCNHQFGDQFCTKNVADFTTVGVVSSFQQADPPYVEASAFGSKAVDEDDPNWFALGRVIIGTETRTCLGQNGNRLYLNAPFVTISNGVAISAVSGDDKRITTCLVKYDNVINYLGTNYVPNQNNGEQAIMNTQNEGGKK